MATYRQIHTHIWDDPAFEELSSDARLVFIWSFSNRHRNEACLYKITVKKIASETGLTAVKVKQALKELISAKMVGYDFEAHILWVRNALKYQTINPNSLRAVKKDLESIGCHYFIKDFIEHYGAMLAAHETIWKPLINGLEMVCKPSNNNNPINNNNDMEEEGGAGEGETTQTQTAFDRFWAAYPKKRAKGDAEKAWNVLKPSEPLVTQIIATLELAKTSAEWRKDGGQFIPYPATWLRRRGWEDEYDNRGGISNGRARTSTDEDTEFAGIYE